MRRNEREMEKLRAEKERETREYHDYRFDIFVILATTIECKRKTIQLINSNRY